MKIHNIKNKIHFNHKQCIILEVLYKWLFSRGINFRYIHEWLQNAKITSSQYLYLVEPV